jgi:phosphate starvation-inducible protein PhoH and related proteins
MFKTKKVRRIILTRPVIPTGKSIGYFPGTLEEKMEPWVVPYIEVLQEVLGSSVVDIARKNREIEVVPFETIRGRSFDDCLIILDEAQNTTVQEIKAFLTRQGQFSTTVILGDLTQTDLNVRNGLQYVDEILERNAELRAKVGVLRFTSADIVRSGLCQEWVKAFERPV